MPILKDAVGPYSIEERVVHGETRWVAIRARGAEWSWLTTEEAAAIGRQWVEKYGQSPQDHAEPKRPPKAADQQVVVSLPARKSPQVA